MTRVALRGLGARKLRALTTMLAVLLGVALVAGTYVLTDTINKSFNDIFEESLKGTDVSVTPRQDVKSDQTAPPAFSAKLLPRVRRVDGVEAAAGSIFSLARFVKKNGDSITPAFSPNFVASELPKQFETLTVVKGRRPRNAHEASLDTQTADRGHLEVGDTLRIAGEEQVTRYRLVGLVRLGQTSFGGAAIAQLTLPEAQRVTDKKDKFDQISVAADNGVSADELKLRIARVMPHSVLVETGKQAAKRQSEDIADQLSFLKILLLVFAGVSLFVGAFLIFNTFSITVAQRVREFGLLRALGASRGQVLRSVVLEAGTIGALGSVLGIAGGIGVARGLNALLRAIGVDLPNTGTVVETRTIVVSVLVGLGVTLVAAMSPALRATRVTPMAALLEAELPEAGRRRRRLYTVLAVLLGVAGIAVTCIGLFGGIDESGTAAGLMGGGAVAVLLGTSLVSPRLVRPLAAVAGWPLEHLRGLTGRLARENALRKPTRTAVTAAALMIGLALVAFVTVFASGIKGSIARAVDRNFEGDLVIQNIDGFSQIPAKAATTTAKVKGVRTVSSMFTAGGKIGHEDIRVTGVDPQTVNQVLSLDWKHGAPDTLSQLAPRDAVVDDAWAKGKGLGVGDRVRIRTPLERRPVFTIRGTVKDNADLIGNVLVGERTIRRDFGTTAPSTTFVKLVTGADARRVQKRISNALENRFPTTEVLNQKELKDTQARQVDQLLGLVYALLSLAVIVSLFGIVNTLALSIHERTRELGLLRAVGMSRSQVRTMIRYEAVITALIGAILGLILGAVFAGLVSRPLTDEGFTLSYPVGTLIMLLVLAAIAGVVAAIGPARRASRLDVLEALAYE
ncbi:MAG TPA: FtsX-like permease family protein [Thermoleophilaceae bacterium]